MSKKLRITKLIALIVFYSTYIIGLLTKPFKLVSVSKEAVYTSVINLSSNFSGLKAFLILVLVITFTILVMLSICLVGECSNKIDSKNKKFLNIFGYYLEDKEMKQFSYILSVIVLITFALNGTSYKGNTLLEVKVSCFTPVMYIVLGVMVINLIIVHLNFDKKDNNDVL